MATGGIYVCASNISAPGSTWLTPMFTGCSVSETAQLDAIDGGERCGEQTINFASSSEGLRLDNF